MNSLLYLINAVAHIERLKARLTEALQKESCTKAVWHIQRLSGFQRILHIYKGNTRSAQKESGSEVLEPVADRCQMFLNVSWLASA